MLNVLKHLVHMHPSNNIFEYIPPAEVYQRNSA